MVAEVDFWKCSLCTVASFSLVQLSGIYFFVVVDRTAPWLLKGAGALASAGAGIAAAAAPLLCSGVQYLRYLLWRFCLWFFGAVNATGAWSSSWLEGQARSHLRSLRARRSVSRLRVQQAFLQEQMAGGAAVVPALGGGAGGVPALRGAFVVTKNLVSDEADEYLLLAPVPCDLLANPQRWIVYTTGDAAPHPFEYRLLELRPGTLDMGAFEFMIGGDNHRQPPGGLGLPVNFICNPANLQVWAPTAPEMLALARQAEFQAGLIYRAQQAGQPPGLVEVQLRGVGGGALPGGPVPGAGGGMAPPVAPVVPARNLAQPPLGGVGLAGGLGLGPLADPGGQGPLDLEQLKMALGDLLKDKKKDKKKDKDKKKKKKKGKKDSDSDSSSSSTSSSGSNSSQKPGKKYAQFLPVGAKKRKLTATHLAKATTMRFKKRSDMLNFHAKYPGALAALLVLQVRQRMGLSMPEDMEKLAETDMSTWAMNTQFHGLKEARDMKEMAFLTKLMLELGHRRIPQAADLLAMRMREMRSAKADGGSWEKAQVLSMMPQSISNMAPLPDNGFVL